MNPIRSISLTLLAVALCAGDAPAAFGAEWKAPKPGLARSKKTYAAELACTGADRLAAWQPAGIQRRDGEQLATAQGRTLALRLDGFEPEQTILSYPLPEGGDGDAWEAGGAGWIGFRCRASGGEATLAMILTGKTRDPAWGNAKAQFTARPGEWQRIVLPVNQFGMKTFHRIGLLGFGVVAAAAGTTVEVEDLQVGVLPCTDDAWARQVVAIPLLGAWRFAPDPAGEGLAKGWQQAGFADADWRTLESGKPAEDQDVRWSGWAWFRQRLVVPAACAGQAMRLRLAAFSYDDEVFVNGVRVGGINGPYRYKDVEERCYIVPASVLKPGQENSIAIHLWGVDGRGQEKERNNGLVAGPWSAEFDPWRPHLRPAGGEPAQELPAEGFDISAGQQGRPCELVFRLPKEVAPEGGRLRFALMDWYGKLIRDGEVPLQAGADALLRGVVPLDAAAARALYLRGRFRANLVATAADGTPLYGDVQEVDPLGYAGRDGLQLPELPATEHDTPLGRLRLVDEIDAATAALAEPHPYMEAGFDHKQDHQIPGSAMQSAVREILGRKACEPGYGWVAWRVGRGRLKLHQPYLLRIEYPEDKPRYGPIEIETGLNYMGVGWRNGVSPDDPYDNWPLSGKWEWFDTVVVPDERTAGGGGACSSDGSLGFWVYVANKLKPQRYFDQYQGGPAIGRIRLYELDAAKHAPAIRLPEGLPQRTLMFDWERQAMNCPGDMVQYAKLMGYTAIAPVILKWGPQMWGEPLRGYGAYNADPRGYWVSHNPDPKSGEVTAPLPGTPSMHAAWLDATRGSGVRYMPRIEYGGSAELPVGARAVGGDGEKATPNRFAQWSANLLNPATWDDLKRTVDHLFKAQAAGNPQLMGMLWRIRCDRMQISFGRSDLELFARETGTKLPALGNKDLADWASGGEISGAYRTWWLQKRADFHARLRDLLKSYRPDLGLWYFNWDSDKWSLGLPDRNSAASFAEVARSRIGMLPWAYANDVALRRRFTGEDYARMLRTGQIFGCFGWGVDYALDGAPYKGMPGVSLFVPVDYRYLGDCPEYLNAAPTGEGVAVSHCVSYDENGSRTLNPKFEGHMVIPGGPDYAMAFEVMAWAHADARTLTYTAYTFGRGFAGPHRRFAQAFLALPAVAGETVAQPDRELRIRRYPTATGLYVGVANLAMAGRTVEVALPGEWKAAPVVTDLVGGAPVPCKLEGGVLRFAVASGPMALDAFVVR